MPSYQTLLPHHIYPFLDSMAALYSQVERDMHSCLMRDGKINVIEKSLQSKYKVDSTTVRNVYHNLKGKHKSIFELRKTHLLELKGTIRSLKNAIKKRLKKKQLNQKDRFFIHQKKRRLAIKIQKLQTHRFVKRNDKWYLHTTVELPDIPWISHRNNGAIGIDLNVNNIAWAYCDHEGNLKQHGQINIDLTDKSSGQATHILSQAIGQIIEVAVEKECPIVIEKLDFSSKKSRLREHSKRYARMLSQFAYSKFSDFVNSKARLSAIQVVEINPAYSSLIGMIKFMGLYGLNSGTSSALVLARRSFRFSERLPRCLNALLQPVDCNKHVWHYWATTSKLLKGCHRHSFFNVRIRFGVTPNIQSSCEKRKILGKAMLTPIIPNYPWRLG